MPTATRVWFMALLLVAALVACGKRESADADRGASLEPPPPQAQATPAPAAGGEWNPAQIAWRTYGDGVRRAKADNKPVCLVFFTTWCPHCKNFSRVFDDPRVVARARDLEMVRVDADAEPDLAAKYAKDGTYIPRTFFLAPDGTLDDSIHPPRPRFQYFYDEQDPGSLLAGMETAIRKLVK